MRPDPPATIVVAALALLQPGPAEGADDWLTPSERNFFKAFGQDVVVGGKSYDLDPNFRSLPEIAVTAESPPRGHLEASLRARARMRVTREDRVELATLQRAAATRLQLQFGVGVVQSLIGYEPMDVAIGMLREKTRAAEPA